MIAEIAAASAAFNVLKSALQQGKELYDCGDAAKNYFDNKSVISKRVAQKGQSDLNAFMALEKIKAEEEWLKDFMIYAGRADMWTDWLTYQSECKRERERAARAQRQKRAALFALMWSVLFLGAGGLLVLPLILFLTFKFFGVI